MENITVPIEDLEFAVGLIEDALYGDFITDVIESNAYEGAIYFDGLSTKKVFEITELLIDYGVDADMGLPF
tara:strand:- start:367 stop:579 length:213 start_codon:yes stop_codon:yes gene_type:complete